MTEEQIDLFLDTVGYEVIQMLADIYVEPPKPRFEPGFLVEELL